MAKKKLPSSFVQDIVRRGFDQTAASADGWLTTFHRLTVAANVLARQREELTKSSDQTVYQMFGVDPPEALGLRAVELMLRGFALENLMKAIWVKRGNPITVDGEMTNVKSHDLGKLAGVLDLTLTAEQTLVLESLTMFSTFLGRYPIPVTWERSNATAVWPAHWNTVLDGVVELLEGEAKK